MSIKLSEVRPTGYDPYEWFFATRFRQGERTIYSIDWSVDELVAFLPKPDPHKAIDVDSAQRRIVPAHAKGFAEYVVDDPGWVSPSLLLRAPNIFEFKRIEEVETGSTQLGLLGVPKHAKNEISIVDGQHRTLGFHLAWEILGTRIEKARSALEASKDYNDPIQVSVHQKDFDEAIARRDQLARERVSVQIIVVESTNVARRIFLDINDNAKGIAGAVKTRFDDRKVLTRALNTVLHDSDLLRDRVDLESDRIGGSSEFLLGAKHVSDILRSLTVGHGRIGARLEEELNEKDMAREFDAFENALIKAFPQLEDVMDGEITPSELRRSNLIGSNVMLRGLALAWYALRHQSPGSKDGWSPEQITTAFAGLEPYMGAPVISDPEDTWYQTGLFPTTENGSYSPTSRAQDFKKLAAFLETACKGEVEWKRVEA